MTQLELSLSGTHPRYMSSGHVVYSTSTNTLMAVPFDADQLEVVGDPVPVLEGVSVSASGWVQTSPYATTDRALVYQVGTRGGRPDAPSSGWTGGQEEPLGMPARAMTGSACLTRWAKSVGRVARLRATVLYI